MGKVDFHADVFLDHPPERERRAAIIGDRTHADSVEPPGNPLMGGVRSFVRHKVNDGKSALAIRVSEQCAIRTAYRITLKVAGATSVSCTGRLLVNRAHILRPSLFCFAFGTIPPAFSPSLRQPRLESRLRTINPLIDGLMNNAYLLRDDFRRNERVKLRCDFVREDRIVLDFARAVL